MSKLENIKVAVRNQRELTKECKKIVSVVERSTYLLDPTNPHVPARQFTFDYSYWSHDSYSENSEGKFVAENDSIYIDQERVFSDLCAGLLDAAWVGYNCTLFAYGQTGSGKTYTMMGYGQNKGLIPMVSESLFHDIQEKGQKAGVIYKLSFSMFEVYNERVFDLLNRQASPQQGLPVRTHHKHGFFVEGLMEVPVSCSGDLDHYIAECNRSRTLAVTNMNETSSRAHTVVTLTFVQNYLKENKTKASKINMVDLAGRSVIFVLFHKAELTKDQIATLSPSDQDFDQTMSTLRYADRVKSIRNEARVNISATDRLIRELLVEKEALLSKLGNNMRAAPGYSKQGDMLYVYVEIIIIRQIKGELLDMEDAWTRRIKETHKLIELEVAAERRSERERADVPHIWNLNEDPVLNRRVYHLFSQGVESTIGNARAVNPQVIELHGPRLCFGSSLLYVFHHPVEERALIHQRRKIQTVTFDLAKEEIRTKTELTAEAQAWLREELSDVRALTGEANAMAAELGRGVRFDPTIVPAIVLGDTNKCSQIYIRVLSGEGGEFLWNREHFIERLDLMMAMYQRYEAGEADWEPSTKTQDPFWEPLETPTLVGVVYVPLEALCYLLDLGEQRLGLYDIAGRQLGALSLSLMPCDATGQDCLDTLAVDNPDDLTWCHYLFYNEKTRRYTDEVAGAVPTFGYKQMHEITNIDQTALDYLQSKSLMIEIHGRQASSLSKRRGSSIDAYTLADQRRISIFTTSSDAAFLGLDRISSAGGNSTSIATSARASSGSIIVETDETDCDSDKESDVTSLEACSGDEQRTGAVLPDIVQTGASSLSVTRTGLELVRKGISSFMEDFIKHHSDEIDNCLQQQ
ncbi:kinesin-like protein KIF28P [Mya arenaria]|uniref:kinesin-like protein KIF28P n=1 Tax=Mya arenaria TaxID=6604 RepID=UPI0022E3C5ED|nr:kinesin-like protein KIF28P [Mya arenaria]